MITLFTDCNQCIHGSMCRWKHNAAHAMAKLKNTRYGTGPNDDYDWNIMMEFQHVNITFSCPDFRQEEPTKRGGAF